MGESGQGSITLSLLLLLHYRLLCLSVDPHIVPPRKNDKFKEALETIMAEIEKKLRIEFGETYMTSMFTRS